MARALAADGVWKRLITDPLSGALLDHGRHTYRPPAALAEFLRARDRHCRVPICRRRALDSQLDHTVGYHTHHGTTDQQNLYNACLCHHRMKDAPGWSVTQHRDGRLTWTTPTGHRYSSRPFDYRPEPDLVAAITALDQAAHDQAAARPCFSGGHRSGPRRPTIRFTVRPTRATRRSRRPAPVLSISVERPHSPTASPRFRRSTGSTSADATAKSRRCRRCRRTGLGARHRVGDGGANCARAAAQVDDRRGGSIQRRCPLAAASTDAPAGTSHSCPPRSRSNA